MDDKARVLDFLDLSLQSDSDPNGTEEVPPVGFPGGDPVRGKTRPAAPLPAPEDDFQQGFIVLSGPGSYQESQLAKERYRALSLQERQELDRIFRESEPPPPSIERRN